MENAEFAVKDLSLGRTLIDSPKLHNILVCFLSQDNHGTKTVQANLAILQTTMTTRDSKHVVPVPNRVDSNCS